MATTARFEIVEDQSGFGYWGDACWYWGPFSTEAQAIRHMESAIVQTATDSATDSTTN